MRGSYGGCSRRDWNALNHVTLTFWSMSHFRARVTPVVRGIADGIRTPNTRAAYYRAVMAFFSWIEACGFRDLATIEPFHVATYIEELGKTHAKPSVKQHLAAIRMLFDYLVIGQVVPMNPASSVRGPRYVLKKGKTPILSGEETRQLLMSLRTDTVVGLRDRALIGVLLLSFARVSAAIHMKGGAAGKSDRLLGSC